MATNTNHHALVIGASGLIGWAVVNQLLQPHHISTPFEKVTALVNRPLKLEDSCWPKNPSEKLTLSLITGFNLMSSYEELETSLREKVSNVESISHVYYFGTMFPMS